jgi:CHAT domain-containing protein
MSPAPGFSVGWEAGASAQIEVFSPDPQAQASAYTLKYTPPFRSTLRPPQRKLQLLPRTVDQFRQKLDELFGLVVARSSAAPPPDTPPADEIGKRIRSFGSQLLNFVVPQNIQAELKAREFYLEIGIDEPLIELPWELLHDGRDFLCLKHRVARFVNVARETPPPVAPPDPWSEGPLSVLIISVPIPQQRHGAQQYTLLTHAQKETDEIIKVIDRLGPAVKKNVLSGSKATADAVWAALDGDERYHIIHFNGHAYFDSEQPSNSSLVLFDDDMPTDAILASFGRKPPLLSFMNGCETAATPGKACKNQFDIFSLARAFLDTGSYLIGNRWKVGDAAAATFASTFYQKLLVEGLPLGTAIRDARIDCRAQMAAYDFSWASYIFYGDPRLCFHKL